MLGGRSKKNWKTEERAALSAAVLGMLLVGAIVTRAAGIEDADPAKGKQVYSLYCQTCHGESGDGQGPAGKALNPPPRDFTAAEFKFGGSDEAIFDVITNGAAAQKAEDGTPGSPLMAPWGNVIPEADRWALVAYIRTLKSE